MPRTTVLTPTRPKCSPPAAASAPAPVPTKKRGSMKIRYSAQLNLTKALMAAHLNTPGSKRPDVGAKASDLLDKYSVPRLKKAGLPVEV